MNLLAIAWKSLKQRWISSSLTSLSIALGAALMVAVLILNVAVARVFQRTGSGYDLVIGAKGSDLQLVLSTIYRMDRPINNLPWRFYKELSEHKWVQRAIPVNVGDLTEKGGFPIVGTTPQYFLTEYAPGSEFKVKGDGLQGTWDAVIGSQVARVNGWDVGSEFKLIHSGADDHVHDEKFTVRGVLAPTGTPNDRTAFVHIDGFFQLDEHDKPWRQAVDREAKFYGVDPTIIEEMYAADIAELKAHEGHDHSGHHHHHGPPPDLQKEVTGILLVMKGEELDRINRARSLQQELRQGFQAQGANTVQVMEQILRNLVGNIQYAFLWLTGLIIAVSGIGVCVSIFNSMSERRKEIAIMRALGAQRQTVLAIVLLESMLLCLLGGIFGIVLGHGLVLIASPIIEARSGLLIDPWRFSPWELVVIPGLMLMSTLVGLLPALTAYRTDVAEALHHS